ncbi:MAG: hypothetical protein V1646_03230 [bacterium]
MKFFRVHNFLVIFLGMSFFSNIKAMDSRPLIVVLDGPTCSGKSSLARCFMNVVEKKQPGRWVYVSVDDVEDGDDCFDEEYLHHATIKNIKDCVVIKNRFVLCDTVISDLRWYNLFREELRNYNVLYVFVHCPLKILVERLTQRNIHARSSGDLPNLRRVVDVMYAFGRMYSKSDQNCGLGAFSYQIFKEIVDSISHACISPQDWNQFGRRYAVFDVKRDEAFYLKLNMPHDLVVYNYPVMQEAQSRDLSQIQKIVNYRCVQEILSRLVF